MSATHPYCDLLPAANLSCPARFYCQEFWPSWQLNCRYRLLGITDLTNLNTAYVMLLQNHTLPHKTFVSIHVRNPAKSVQYLLIIYLGSMLCNRNEFEYSFTKGSKEVYSSLLQEIQLLFSEPPRKLTLSEHIWLCFFLRTSTCDLQNNERKRKNICMTKLTFSNYQKKLIKSLYTSFHKIIWIA